MASQLSRWHFSFELNTTGFHIDNRGLFLLLFVCSSVVLITAFFLCAQWICHRYRRLSNASSAPATIAPVQQATSLGLHQAIINVMPIIIFMTTNVANDVIVETECSICLSLFEDEEKVKVLAVCSHVYHSECIDMWLSSQSSCPVCRASLRPQSNEEL
ncbi:hypothetical protein OIU78_008279 [Salix suchowensis]|nr:RING-H2 finger protein [Salix suchowensis]KAJ6345590.1 hypothetical protein OIU78_008279 [Salix suchowensis]